MDYGSGENARSGENHKRVAKTLKMRHFRSLSVSRCEGISGSLGASNIIIADQLRIDCSTRGWMR
eukprot:scaffold409_cov167-Ochromonas_danica.AAC.12